MSDKLQQIKRRLELESIKIKFNQLLELRDQQEVKRSLLDCLEMNGLIEEPQPVFQQQISYDEEEFIPNEQEFREDLFLIRNRTQQKIDIPTNLTTIIVDGKKYTIDLVKVSKWTLKEQPQYLRLYKNGIENITKIVNQLQNQNIQLKEQQIMEVIGSLYWNILIYFDKINFRNFKSKEAKVSYQVLSILYGVKSVLTNIDKKDLLGNLLKQTQLTETIINYYFVTFKNILKNSFISEQLSEQMDTSKFDTPEVNAVMDSIIENNILPKDNYTFGAIVFYIKKTKNPSITLKYIQDLLNLDNAYKLKNRYSVVYNYVQTNNKLKKVLKKSI